MKIIRIFMSLTMLSTMVQAQDQGMLDQLFGNGGKYTLQHTNEQLNATFIDVHQYIEENNPHWKIILGGNRTIDNVDQGIFLWQINDLGLTTEWYGNGESAISYVRDGKFSQLGELFVCGYKGSFSDNDPALCSIPDMLEQNPILRPFGNFDIPDGDDLRVYQLMFWPWDLLPADYMGFCGSYQPAGGLRTSCIMTLSAEGEVTHRELHDTDGISTVYYDLLATPNGWMATGMQGNQGLISLFSRDFTNGQHRLFPEVTIPEYNYVSRWLVQDPAHIYAGGYILMHGSTDTKSLIQAFNKETLEPEPDAFGGFNGLQPDGFPEGWVNSAISRIGVKFPFEQAGGLKIGDEVLYVAGSVKIGESPLTSYICALNGDGTLREDFGENGFFLVEPGVENKPVDMLITEEGDLLLAVNAGESVSIYKVLGYKESSAINGTPAIETALRVWPNPAQNNIRLDFTLTNGCDVEIQLLTIEGRLIKSFRYQKFLPGNQQILLDLPDMVHGVYLLKLVSGEGTKFSRVLHMN